MDLKGNDMDQICQKIIDAVIARAEKVCPDSLAFIGVYGSMATGDVWEKSDLDLLILIKDNAGWKLGDGFILDDTDVGYDIYCTNWEMLEGDAACAHAHLSKLMDAKVVYVKDPDTLDKLDALRKKAVECLASEKRFEQAGDALQKAKMCYAECCLSSSLSQVRTWAGCAVNVLLDAVMLYHGRYFHYGIKRTFEEVSELKLPFDMAGMVCTVVRAETAQEVTESLKILLCAVRDYLHFPQNRTEATAENLRGTYEEMYSNWKNKMVEAAAGNDVFASFMNLLSLQYMIHGLAAETTIEDFEIMDQFDPADLAANARAFDGALQKYLAEYEKHGVEVRHHANVDAFVTAYLDRQA